MNSPNWIEYIGDRNIRTEEDAVAYIEKNFIPSYSELGFGFYKDKTPIGICGFIKHDYLDHPDIGFAILPQFEGKGFVSEAAQSVFEYGMNELKLKPILGITTHKNVGSRRILSKIGLNEVGKITPPNSEEELILFSNDA
jgi:RimJ/RimL family protein N-acetyltransferase